MVAGMGMASVQDRATERANGPTVIAYAMKSATARHAETASWMTSTLRRLQAQITAAREAEADRAEETPGQTLMVSVG